MNFWFMIAAMFLQVTLACKNAEVVVSNLSQTEANEILVVLDSHDIKASLLEKPGKKTSSYSIEVLGKNLSHARQILVSNMLPKDRSVGFIEMYPPGSAGLIPTKGDEKAKFLMAVQGEIENMIKILPGVLRAKVAVVMPDSELIRDPNREVQRARASVAILYDPDVNGQQEPFGKDDVAILVASAVEGLDPVDVTVLMAKGSPIQVSRPKQETLALSPSHNKYATLLWVYGILAVLGFVVAVGALARASQFRAQIRKMRREFIPSHLEGEG